MRMYFGPRKWSWVMNSQDRWEQKWNELNRAAMSNPHLMKWLNECRFDKGIDKRAILEQWAAILKYAADHPVVSDEEREFRRRKAALDQWRLQQKATAK